MNISLETKIGDLKKSEKFGEIGKYMVYTPGPMGRLMYNGLRLSEVQKHGWNHESVIYGLDRLTEVIGKGPCFHRIYSDAQCADDKMKKDVNIVFFPKTRDCGEKPFILICAGGGYECICSISEGYPVAARFNELGYDTFILTYRVCEKGLMLRPIDDVAAALHYIFNDRARFGVGTEYVLCGFSAGANLISLFGTDNLGYKKYDLPKPRALFPIYTFVDIRVCGDNFLRKLVQKIMFGKDSSEETLEKYNIRDHLEEYPPCYIVCGKSDSTVPPINSELLQKCLEERGIPSTLEEGENADHGFGEGRGTSLEGWYLRADAFLSGLA